MKKRISSTLLGILVLMPIFTLAITTIQPTVAQSYSASLDYGEYYAVSSVSTLSSGDDIYWSFSASNNVYLDVWILDDSEYAIYNSGGSATGYHVSDYEGSSDSGYWSIAYNDVWYVIFLHDDGADPITTYVSMTVNFPGSGFSGNYTTIIAIAAVVIVAIVVGTIIMQRRKKQMAASQPVTTYQDHSIISHEPQGSYQPPQSSYQAPQNSYQAPPPMNESTPQPSPAEPKPQVSQKFCPYCGSQNDSTSRFCMNCGADILNE